MLWAAMSLKLITEVALMAMAGRWLLTRMLPGAAQRNPFWRLLDWLVRPFEAGLARITGGRIAAAQLGRLTGAALAALWLLATLMKIRICLGLGAGACH